MLRELPLLVGSLCWEQTPREAVDLGSVIFSDREADVYIHEVCGERTGLTKALNKFNYLRANCFQES